MRDLIDILLFLSILMITAAILVQIKSLQHKQIAVTGVLLTALVITSMLTGAY